MAQNIPETKSMNECMTLEKGMPSGRLPVGVGTAERGLGQEHPGRDTPGDGHGALPDGTF